MVSICTGAGKSSNSFRAALIHEIGRVVAISVHLDFNHVVKFDYIMQLKNSIDKPNIF